MSECGGVNASSSSSSSSSSLAIVEKKPQKSGGCVGIFFQLFDWNRRFAKKKFFSKKLLPPARAKQDAKKFGGDEKQPKLRLIAGENAKKNGAFEQKHGVKTPSLVARLMGLDAMPMVQQQDKLKKTSSSVNKDKKQKFESGNFEFGRQNKDLEKGGTKHEVRPPKLQKTGLLERHPVTKFGTEALHFKNVLSQSRKHHHHHHLKLLSPVKNSSNHSGRNSSRLLGAATKILEPGFQARNKAKSALTYSHNVRHCSTNGLMSESMKPISPEGSDHYYMSEGKSLKGQSSCKNCGNLLDVVQCRPNMNDLPSAFVPAASSPVHMSQMSKPGVSFSSLEQESERVFRKRQEHSHSASLARAVDHIRNHQGQGQRHSTSQPSTPQTSPISVGYKIKLQSQNEVGPNYKHKNRFMLASNAVGQTKDFAAFNRGLNGQTWSKRSAKVDEFKFETVRTFGNKREDLSPGRKRRVMNVCKLGEIENSHNGNSTPDKQRYIDGSGNKDDAFAFRFSSAMKHKSEITSKRLRRDQNIFIRKSNLRKTLPNETGEKICFQKPFPLTGDTLGALLDQRLKALTSQEDDKRAFGAGTQPKRTSSVILQELILALTTERQPPHKEMDFGPYAKPFSKYPCHSLNPETDLRFKGKSENAGASFRYACGADHHNPGCLPEASSSNDSCLLSSPDDSSGHILHDATSCSYDYMNVESDDFYGGASLSKQSSVREFVIDLLNYISEVLYNIDLSEARLKGNKLNHVKEVIFNAELVLGHAALTSSHQIETFSASNFLLDELETLSSVLLTNFGDVLGFKNTKEGNQLKGFIFDCLIEYLDLTYGSYSKSRFGAWKALPFRMNAEKMIHEIVEEVREWMSLGGLIRDELIEREMSHGFGKWTDFEMQAFETGVDIEWMVLHGLVDEVVVDLYECNMGS